MEERCGGGEGVGKKRGWVAKHGSIDSSLPPTETLPQPKRAREKEEEGLASPLMTL